MELPGWRSQAGLRLGHTGTPTPLGPVSASLSASRAPAWMTSLLPLAPRSLAENPPELTFPQHPLLLPSGVLTSGLWLRTAQSAISMGPGELYSFPLLGPTRGVGAGKCSSSRTLTIYGGRVWALPGLPHHADQGTCSHISPWQLHFKPKGTPQIMRPSLIFRWANQGHNKGREGCHAAAGQ